MNPAWRLVFVLVVAGAVRLGIAAPPPQVPAYSSKVEVVRVDVLVTERGQVVGDLRAPDFEVMDNGVPQQVDFVSFEQIPLNVILALDVSESVAGERMSNLRTAGRAVLDALDRDDQAALITFNNQVRLGSELTRDVPRVRAELERTVPHGTSAIIDACFAAMVLGDSELGRSVLIVFSDGVDTSSWLTADRVLETAKRSDVVVYSVSAGRSWGATFLEQLSKYTGGTRFEVESTKNVAEVFLRILGEFRQRYLIGYSPRGVEQGGWHSLDVRVNRRNVRIKARPGYQAAR